MTIHTDIVGTDALHAVIMRCAWNDALGIRKNSILNENWTVTELAWNGCRNVTQKVYIQVTGSLILPFFFCPDVYTLTNEYI